MSDGMQPPDYNEAPHDPSSDDPAAAAFEALREEVALVRRAVTGLAAERAATAIPDYSETLGRILQASKAVAGQLKTFTELPALRLTPDAMAREIAAAAEIARRADHVTLMETSAAFRESTGKVQASLRSVRAADRQRLWLLATSIAAIVAGAVLWSIVTGLLASTTPITRQSPEQRAAAILQMDEAAAGEHLIQTSEPELWRDLVFGDHIVIANRNVLKLCQGKTGKQRGHCIIKLSAD